MRRLDRADAVPGWMTGAELAWLEKAATGRKLVIELGSWCGRSSVALTAAERLVCVDNWVGSPNCAEGAVDWTAVRRRFEVTLAPEITAGTVEMLVGELSDPGFRERLVSLFPAAADMVFVDASHEYQDVARDIATARRLLAAGGLLCGHDYCGAWPGVVRAVDECRATVGRGPDSIWYCA